MSAFKRLTPDPAEWIHEARRASDELAHISNRVGALLGELEASLQRLQQHGCKAEKLDYCVRRVQEIRFALNGAELGSFCAVSVGNTLSEIWRTLP